MKCHKKVVIGGRVQGVWFRKYAQDKAEGFGLSGYVKNEIDGTVYIEVSGEDEHVNAFIQWCHAGPPLAHVETVEVNENTFHHYDGFIIKE
jgi:acylphosphatase